MKKLVVILAVLLAVTSCAEKEILFTQGAGVIDYVCQEPNSDKTLQIYYYIPEGDVANMPVQIVMHGMGRNGDGYRDSWIKKADKYGFVVITPTFSMDQFTEETYQQGNVVNAEGSFNEFAQMTYVIIDQVFDYFLKHSESKAKKYNIYGHSAGGQFVHRYLLFGRSRKIDKAIAANAGWYTFPTDTTAYPYGIGDAEQSLGLDIASYYAKDLTILLGDADTLRTSSLRQTPEADGQGMYRLARGENFFSFCQADAERRGVPFNWKKAYVAGSNHSNNKMAPVAADIIYGE